MLLYEKGLDLLELKLVTTNINIGLMFLRVHSMLHYLPKSLHKQGIQWIGHMYLTHIGCILLKVKFECYFGLLCDVYNIWKKNVWQEPSRKWRGVFSSGCEYFRLVHIYEAMCNLYICKYIILFFLQSFWYEYLESIYIYDEYFLFPIGRIWVFKRVILFRKVWVYLSSKNLHNLAKVFYIV